MEPAGLSPGIQNAERQWADFIRRIARKDADALRDLYEGTSVYVYGLVFQIVRDPGISEEITLDVYTQVWKMAADYDAARGAPSAWLLGIARTRAIGRIRSGFRSDAFPPETPVTENPVSASRLRQEENHVMDARRERVQSALADLPPEQRQAVDMAFAGGLSQSEIAALIGQPPKVVKERLRLSMMRLREKLQAIP